MDHKNAPQISAHVSLPLHFSLLIATDQFEARHIVLLSVITNYSLLPLLFTPELIVIKLSLYLLYISFTLYCCCQLYPNHWKHLWPIHERIYIYGFALIFFYEYILQYMLGWSDKYEFLPLLLTSVYCSLGITYFWLTYYIRFLMLRQSGGKITATTVNNVGTKKKKKL